MVIEDSVLSAVTARTQTTSADVEVYDFARRATLSREHARVLELAFETFTRQWASQLSARIRGRAQITVDAVTMQTYADYAESLPATTMMVVCALPTSEDRVILQFPVSAATAWIVQMVGGRPSTKTSEDRVLTPIEQALVRAITEEALESLTHAMDGILPPGVVVVGVQHNSQFAQVAAAGDLVVVARLSIRFGGRTVDASVMLPAPIALSGLPGRGAAPTIASPGLMRRQVEESMLEISLRLAPLVVRPRDVLDLSVGDVIAVPHSADRPLELMVGGHTVATAAVGTSGARLACVITATTPDPAPAEESA